MGSDERKAKLITYLNGQEGITFSIPKLQDAAKWREPYLSRTQSLMALYDQAFRSIDFQSRNLLSDPVRKPEHIFSQSDNGLERVVVQLQQAKYGSRDDHLFAEFITQSPNSAELGLPISKTSPTIAQRLHSLVDYLLPDEGLQKPEEQQIPEPIIPDASPLVTRLIAVPPMDEGVIGKDIGQSGLFLRDLGQWWKQFFGDPTISSETFLANIPQESRRLTAWVFRYGPSGAIDTLEYLRRNYQQPRTFGKEAVRSDGIKLTPPNSAGFQNKHSQILTIDMETGNVINKLSGIALHGPKDQPTTLEFALLNGMLDQKGARFDDPIWSFDQVVSSVIGDIPIDINSDRADS